MTLTPNMQMSQLSLAYISAVASDAGYEVSEPAQLTALLQKADQGVSLC